MNSTTNRWVKDMRFLVQVLIPVERGNETVADGSLPKIMGQILEDLKPEAAYFSADEGLRGCHLVVNVDVASDLPKVAEPFFLAFDAEVRFEPVMIPEDLMKAGSGMESSAKKYG